MTGAQAMHSTRRREVVPSSVLGMLLFIGAEVMFFAGLISAFTITRAGMAADSWQLPMGATLPVVETAFNSLALLASGIFIFTAGRQARRRSTTATRTWLIGCVLGALFVVLQGREWWRLLSQGLTIRSGELAAFFYVIVGTHAVHAIGALIVLAVTARRLSRGTASQGLVLGAETLWYFVVGVWPIIYLRVYF
jgi:cytochrome c oxidase subunit 3